MLAKISWWQLMQRIMTSETFSFSGPPHVKLWVGFLINKMYLNILLNSDDLLPSELKYFRCLFELIHKPICHCQNLLEFCQNSLYCENLICETLMFVNARMRDWCLLVKTLENSWSSMTKTRLHNLPVTSLKMFYNTKFTFLPFEASIETGENISIFYFWLISA